jgi:16S rRNA (guanine966-N2)-methyltransferase
LRIVGGEYKGRKIAVSRSFDSRPTTDFAREALFNILNNHVDFEEIKVLDLFAGTGSISFEFASRGCTDIDLVDINGNSVHFIGKTAAEFGMKGIHPVRMDVFRFIHICDRQYDVIFADPPFDLAQLPDLPENILSRNLLMPGGLLILEHPAKYNFSKNIHFTQERKYGNVHFSFFR